MPRCFIWKLLVTPAQYASSWRPFSTKAQPVLPGLSLHTVTQNFLYGDLTQGTIQSKYMDFLPADDGAVPIVYVFVGH